MASPRPVYPTAKFRRQAEILRRKTCCVQVAGQLDSVVAASPGPVNLCDGQLRQSESGGRNEGP